MLVTRRRIPAVSGLERHHGGAINRTLDVCISVAALFLLAPLMILVALAIWIDSGRPIFFSQVRVGQGGRHFRLYKFRKFRPNQGGLGHAVTLQNDPRLTPLGSVLAWTKLDELPQLWNVLTADMSIVGPRPETLEFADCFRGSYRKVLDYKPGIFGPNQVFFRNESLLYTEMCDPQQFYREVLFPLKARVDLTYFPSRNLFLDIAWIFRGVLAIFGLRSCPRESVRWIEKVEDWIKQSQRDHHRPIAAKRS
jgi:lipopolysaccharide/colanic/teichoic acid biosynthesis glycosyltransferase